MVGHPKRRVPAQAKSIVTLAILDVGELAVMFGPIQLHHQPLLPPEQIDDVVTVAEGSESLIVLEQGAELCISADAPVDELLHFASRVRFSYYRADDHVRRRVFMI